MEKKIYILRKYVSGSVYDLENLSKKQINCVAPKLFNDPIDTYFYYSDSDCFSESKKILTPEIMDTIRITCFINHQNILKKRKGNKLTPAEILMWTHYANSHKGICLEYEVPAENFNYLDKLPFDDTKTYLANINYQPELATDFESVFSKTEDASYSAKEFEQLLRTCFFTKDKSFEYEDEMRLLTYTKNTKNNYHSLKFNYLKKIVFGERCDSDMKYLINCINKQVYSSRIELYEINNHFAEVKYNDR